MFTLLFTSFSERVIGSDCASKLFMTILYGIYTGINIYFGAVLWARLLQSTHSTNRYSEMFCARFWIVVVQMAIEKFQIPLMQDSFMYAISLFHTTNMIIAYNSKFSFVGSIPEAMFRDDPAASKILKAYRKLPVSRFHLLTPWMKSIINEADKPKK